MNQDRTSLCQKEASLLEPIDGLAYESINREGHAPLVLVCDHASNRVPEKLSYLGLSQDQLDKHIAYDIGAAEVTKILAHRLNAQATLSCFSRLVIDANRYLSDATSIPAVSDQITVPMNERLDLNDAMLRVEELFVPYHQAIERKLCGLKPRWCRPIFVSIHSFTPVYQGFHRPWHVGVLWNNDEDTAQLLIEQLQAQFGDWVIGDNQPYNACEPVGYTMETHAQTRGLPEVLLEIRQDLIDTPAGQERVAARLERLLGAVMETIYPDFLGSEEG